ncbi:conjugal transfer protein TraD [Klebsiella pneumoniae]|nr:conjugal transfer protein TraD [Klebsiella pneumoniae]
MLPAGMNEDGVIEDMQAYDGVLGIFRPKTTKCSGGRAVRGLQRGITFR